MDLVTFAHANPQLSAGWRSSFDEAPEHAQDLPDLARMLEPVTRLFPVSFVSDDTLRPTPREI